VAGTGGRTYALHLLLAGLAFAIAFVRTGSLWLGLGLHAGWNAGAYLLREGDPALLRLAGALPEGWGGGPAFEPS
jgi:membrane protease YdiL (CAAX protease family)